MARQFTSFAADGQLLDDGTHRYAWDAAGRLLSVTDGVTGHVTSYVYDGLGRRLQASRQGGSGEPAVIRYLWCGRAICQTRDGNDAVSADEYAQGELHGRNAWYYVRDQLGSVIGVADATGRVRGTTAYGAYGATETARGVQSDLGYAGMWRDPDSSLYLTWYRVYDPAVGRWLSRDPIGEMGGQNVYAYVGGNPVNLIDPMGLAPGDSFSSVQAAAIDALRYISSKSDRCEREYGGWIYKKWSFFGPPTYTYDEPTPLSNTGGDLPYMPAWHEIDAMFHNHPSLDGYDYNHFSFDDKDTAAADNIPSYLLTPDGTILRFTPAPGGDRDSGIVTVVGHD
jgi:RHS repeat-associated protein